jgi:hypothetical protein
METAVLPTDSSVITSTFTFTYSITNEREFTSLQAIDRNKNSYQNHEYHGVVVVIKQTRLN